MSEKQTPRPKHIPQRMCVVCRQREGKRQLTRIVRTEAGVCVDISGKMRGRGAYLCSDRACWERAVNSEVLNRALRTMLTDADHIHLKEAYSRQVGL